MDDRLPDWVRQYIGIPYGQVGRNREEGLDCYGLFRLVFKEQFNYELPEFAHTYTDTKRDFKEINRALVENRHVYFKPVPESQIHVSRGVGVLLPFAGLPLHVGVYSGRENGHRYVLHTTSSRGHSYLERLDGPNFGTEPLKFYELA